MPTITAFTPVGNTIVVNPGTTSAQFALANTVNPGFEQVRICNRTNQDVYVAWGTSSSVTAVVPTIGSPSAVVHIPPNDVEVISPTFGSTNLAYIVAATATGNLYFLQGEGL